MMLKSNDVDYYIIDLNTYAHHRNVKLLQQLLLPLTVYTILYHENPTVSMIFIRKVGWNSCNSLANIKIDWIVRPNILVVWKVNITLLIC